MKAIRITTEQELEQAFKIRREVFVNEQGVSAEEEYDRYDKLHGPCEHVLLTYEGEPVGAGRLRVVDGYGKLERICILKPYRKYGLGKFIVKSLEDIAREKGLSKTKLNGQIQAEGFYHKLGYQTVSDIFLDAGIPHVTMVKELEGKENAQ